MWNSSLKIQQKEYITVDELLAASHLQRMSQFQQQLGVIRKKKCNKNIS
jgi:hypothetical protein